MLALDNEHNEIAKFLMDKGAYLDVWDWWGRTPLWIAVDRKVPPGGPVGGGFGADLEVARGVVAVDSEPLDLDADAATAAAIGALRQSAIRMRPRRFRAWRLSIGCWLRVSM